MVNQDSCPMPARRSALGPNSSLFERTSATRAVVSRHCQQHQRSRRPGKQGLANGLQVVYEVVAEDLARHAVGTHHLVGRFLEVFGQPP